MSDTDVVVDRVISVLLNDGWHQTVPGSFSVGPLRVGGDAEIDVPGFRFEEADVGSPYRPTTLTGPLNSIIAVRQATPAVRRIGAQDRSRAAHNGQRAAHGSLSPVPAGRRAAEG